MAGTQVRRRQPSLGMQTKQADLLWARSQQSGLSEKPDENEDTGSSRGTQQHWLVLDIHLRISDEYTILNVKLLVMIGHCIDRQSIWHSDFRQMLQKLFQKCNAQEAVHFNG